MSKKVVRTIAFQINDDEFLKEYDRRQQESGLSVKNYFISLIKADIALHQTQADSPLQEEQDGDIPSVVSEPEQTAELPEQETELSENIVTETEDLLQVDESDLQQNQPDAPAEEMMNLFVKITKEQREALEAHKNETGETVGRVLNRVIDDFLNHTDSLPKGFEEAFQHYTQNPKLCDTTSSAKIPVRTNQELTDYLESFGGSRNALMAALVDLELNRQELTETQDESQGMTMM